MPAITLPDGSQRKYEQPVSVMDVAADIGPGLAKATLAGEVDGKLRDASHLIDADADVRIITARDPEGLEVIRHSTAHLLAQAFDGFEERECRRSHPRTLAERRRKGQSTPAGGVRRDAGHFRTAINDGR